SKSGLESLPNNTAGTQLHLVNAVRTRRVGVSQTIDHKRSEPWDRCESFSQPLRGKMAWDHRERDKWPPARGDKQAGQRNQGLAGPPLRHPRRRTSLGKPLDDAKDRDRLCRVRPAEQLREQRRRWVLRAVQRGKRVKDSLSKFSCECPQIVTYRGGPL